MGAGLVTMADSAKASLRKMVAASWAFYNSSAGQPGMPRHGRRNYGDNASGAGFSPEWAL